MKLKCLTTFLPKSKIKAGSGINNGKYPFFTSSDTLSLYLDDYLYDCEAIILGTGGRPSCNYYNGKFSVSTDNFVIKTNNKINTKFLYYFLRKDNLLVLEKGFHGAGLKHIGKDYVSEIEVPCPSMLKQQKIVSLLDKINEIINYDKKAIKLLNELVRSRFIEMFGNVLKNDKNWETHPMKLLCREIGDGLHGTPEYDNNGEYYFINGNNLEEKRICIKTDTKRVSETECLKHFIELDCNTVLISINGTFGKTAFYNNEKIILGKSACYLKLKKMLNKEFVLNMFGTSEWMQYMEENSTGTTIKNFGLKAMRDFEMILPPIELQNEFADFVKLIDKSKFNIQQHTKLMQELLDKMMCNYFGGNE